MLLFMTVSNRSDDLLEDLCSFLFVVHILISSSTHKITSCSHLHDQEDASVVVVNLIQFDDIWMVKSLESHDFSFESFELGNVFIADAFDSPDLSGGFMFGFVYLPIAALTDGSFVNLIVVFNIADFFLDKYAFIHTNLGITEAFPCAWDYNKPNEIQRINCIWFLKNRAKLFSWRKIH